MPHSTALVMLFYVFVELQYTQEHVKVGGPRAAANHLWVQTSFLRSWRMACSLS